MIVWYPSSERKHVYKVFGTFFLFLKKKQKKTDRQTLEKTRWTARKKFVVLCFAYFALASLITGLFPHKGAWYWKGSSCKAATLCLNSGKFCHGRQFTAWLWTARFWDQKVSCCCTNVFFVFIFGSFLISWANWVLLDDFKGERLPHAQRKRWEVKDVSWLDIYKSLFFFWFCVNRSCLMRVFPQRFFFKQYAAPSTETFIWPSFHFHNFTQRFYQWNRHLVSSVGIVPVCWAGGGGFEPWLNEYSGSLNNWEESAAFVMTSGT